MRSDSEVRHVRSTLTHKEAMLRDARALVQTIVLAQEELEQVLDEAREAGASEKEIDEIEEGLT